MAAARNTDVTPLLEQVGIDPRSLGNSRARVASETMEKLLCLLIPTSGDPLLGLHSARFVEPASYGVLGYITMNCSTLREVLAKIPVFEPIVGDMGVSVTEIRAGHALQCWQCQFRDPLARRHEIENVLASWHTYASKYLLLPALCEKVYFEHSAPQDPALLDDYREVFGCEPLFDQPFSGLEIPLHFLDQPIPQADQHLLQTLLDHATGILSDLHHNQPLVIQVKNLLRLTIREQAPSSSLIAKKLGMSSRTLQRRLGEEGVQYKDLLNEVRLDMALHYLQNTALSLDNIAYELGYAEARSFYRSFKQWTGRTAGSYRP